MIVKTSELKGKALDWAAALADGFEADYLKRSPDAIPNSLKTGTIAEN
ncbi:hypothetical protein [Arsenophonus endosymbiont of Apis mellifera]|nr:hypothetical protein [Arsenophonus endosymbiont of Apis mellifera]